MRFSVPRNLRAFLEFTKVYTHFIMKESARPQGAIPAVFRLEPLNSVDLFEASIPDLQRHLQEGKFTSVEYIQYCLERIRQTNPYLEAVIEVNPDAVDIASKLGEERQNGTVRGPLHGIPVLVKDVRPIAGLVLFPRR